MLFIAVILLSAGLQLFMPWWCIVIISFAASGIVGKTPKISFWQCFFAIFILWSGMAVYESLPNANRLADRVAIMFGLNYWPLLVAVTALLAALVAGISGLCGHHFRKAILSIKSKA